MIFPVFRAPNVIMMEIWTDIPRIYHASLAPSMSSRKLPTSWSLIVDIYPGWNIVDKYVFNFFEEQFLSRCQSTIISHDKLCFCKGLFFLFYKYNFIRYMFSSTKKVIARRDSSYLLFRLTIQQPEDTVHICDVVEFYSRVHSRVSLLPF